MGDSTLVFNQIAVIEDLEGKVHSYREIHEEMMSEINELQYELERYDSLKASYLRPLTENTLEEVTVTLIAGEEFPFLLLEFLEFSGCQFDAVALGPTDILDVDLEALLHDHLKNGNAVFILAGDLTVFVSALKEGMAERKRDHTWIVLDTGLSEERYELTKLPDNWNLVKRGDTFLGMLTLWELLKPTTPES